MFGPFGFDINTAGHMEICKRYLTESDNQK